MKKESIAETLWSMVRVATVFLFTIATELTFVFQRDAWNSSQVSEEVDPARFVVLGREILEDIHRDIGNIVLPSWIGRVPNNLGSASHGTLSADQWRTACTVNLVTSLVRIWGPSPAQTRERQMLENFVDLVTATKLANMRIMTTERATEYLQTMHRYLQGIKTLYPHRSLLPYHHLSLHFSRFLEDFGPTNGWRCFPFERYNYLLQKVQTNSRFGKYLRRRHVHPINEVSGEMEATMFEHFVAGQRIRARIADRAIPPTETDRLVRDTFTRVFQNENRGTLMNDLWSFDDKPPNTPDKSASKQVLLYDIYALAKERIGNNPPGARFPDEPVLIQPNLRYKGVTFSTYIDSPGNSNVVFGDYPGGAWSAGRISTIFFWPSKSPGTAITHIPLCVVEPLHALTEADARNDPYRLFRGDIVGRLFYASFSSSVVLRFEDISCHFASTSFCSIGDIRLVHVLPLDRVRRTSDIGLR